MRVYRILLILIRSVFCRAQGLGDGFTGVRGAFGASHKIVELLDRKPPEKLRLRWEDGQGAGSGPGSGPGPGPSPHQELRGKIEFRNVSFRYSTRNEQPVLKVAPSF